MSGFAAPLILRGAHADLVPLAPEHHADLCAAVRDGELWRLPYTSVPSPDTMAAEIERRLMQQRAGAMLPFAVLDKAGRAVGMTGYLNIDAANRRVEIGATWYRRAVQRTGINSTCKFLLLNHAFETLDCIAVELRTHAKNLTSRRAIERLGARQDGLLRSHQIMANGDLRDTVVYSIIAAEWPGVKAALSARLKAGPPPLQGML